MLKQRNSWECIVRTQIWCTSSHENLFADWGRNSWQNRNFLGERLGRKGKCFSIFAWSWSSQASSNVFHWPNHWRSFTGSGSGTCQETESEGYLLFLSNWVPSNALHQAFTLVMHVNRVQSYGLGNDSKVFLCYLVLLSHWSFSIISLYIW